jgi:hypothetical protein
VGLTHSGWSFDSAREPARFAAAKENGPSQTEHAFRSAATLCGLPEEQVAVYRHLFRPDGSRACPRCREFAAAAPTVPCVQERLHDRVVTAAPGALRSQLIDALRSGAGVPIWINGPADKVSGYARLDRITDGAETIRDLFTVPDRTGVARVAHPSGEFIVILPEHSVPVIAFAAHQAPSA